MTKVNGLLNEEQRKKLVEHIKNIKILSHRNLNWVLNLPNNHQGGLTHS